MFCFVDMEHEKIVNFPSVKREVTFTAHLPGASNCAIIVAAINCNNKGLR